MPPCQPGAGHMCDLAAYCCRCVQSISDAMVQSRRQLLQMCSEHIKRYITVSSSPLHSALAANCCRRVQSTSNGTSQSRHLPFRAASPLTAADVFGAYQTLWCSLAGNCCRCVQSISNGTSQCRHLPFRGLTVTILNFVWWGWGLPSLVDHLLPTIS